MNSHSRTIYKLKLSGTYENLLHYTTQYYIIIIFKMFLEWDNNNTQYVLPAYKIIIKMKYKNQRFSFISCIYTIFAGLNKSIFKK